MAIRSRAIVFGFVGLAAVASVAVLAMGKSSNSEKSEHPMAMDHSSHRPKTTMPHHAPGGQAQDDHNGHPPGQKPSASISPKLSLVTANAITPNQPVPLAIQVKDSQGKAITQFDTFQEKRMHLIVISDDLQFFDHLHPNYQDAGRFEVTANFPKPGNYTLFSDYKPKGQKEIVSILKTTVPGSPVAPPPLDLSTTKTVANTAIHLTLSTPKIISGKEVTVTFHLKDGMSNQPISDLKPYLGEQGHLVILKQSNPLTQNDYIHAHAMRNTPTGQVQFMTTFPKPGNYKLWGQFNRNGTIIVGEFWVNVR